MPTFTIPHAEWIRKFNNVSIAFVERHASTARIIITANEFHPLEPIRNTGNTENHCAIDVESPNHIRKWKESLKLVPIYHPISVDSFDTIRSNSVDQFREVNVSESSILFFSSFDLVLWYRRMTLRSSSVIAISFQMLFWMIFLLNFSYNDRLFSK